MKTKITFLLSLGVMLCGSSIVSVAGRGTDFSKNAQTLRRIGNESKTSEFNQMMVDHATRLCNNGFYKMFMQEGREFIGFFKDAGEMNLTSEQVYTCVRMFKNNGADKCEVIDNTVVEQVTAAIPSLFSKYFVKDDEEREQLDALRVSVEDLLRDRFITQFESFRIEPNSFLLNLSKELVSLIKPHNTIIAQDHEAAAFKEKLRQILIRLIDTMLTRTVWYTDAAETIWVSFKAVADNLHAIGEAGIIDQDELDELWNTNLDRFMWFIDLKSNFLPLSFFEQVESDLKANKVFFLTVDEQDEGLKTKKAYLMDALVTAKAKAIAFQQAGIIDPVMVH